MPMSESHSNSANEGTVCVAHELGRTGVTLEPDVFGVLPIFLIVRVARGV